MEALEASAQFALPEKDKVIFDLEETFMHTSQTAEGLLCETGA